MSALLRKRLAKWASTPFRYGVADCAASVCDWLVDLGYPDPMADLRGKYDDSASCDDLTGWSRDPVGAVADRLAQLGLMLGNELSAGDVAIIRPMHMEYPISAVWTGTAWAAKGETGVVVLTPRLVEVVAFWSVGHDPAGR